MATAKLALDVPPAVHSAIEFRTMPDAICIVHPADSSDATNSFSIYADDEGRAIFYVRPPAEADAAAELSALCTSSGAALTHPIELHPVAGAAPVVANRSKTETKAAASSRRKVRPALTGDPMRFSQQELRSAGYPMRPDPQQQPGSYANWLKAVSKPATFIPPRSVTLPGQFHGPRRAPGDSGSSFDGSGKSFNWSGYDLTSPPLPFFYVEGTWWVPAVTGNPPNNTYSSEWIGLDGDYSDDVVQCGTRQDTYQLHFGYLTWQFNDYYVWTEIYPLPEQRLAPFAVSPGDEIFSQVWIGNWLEQPSLSGSNGFFQIEDITNGVYTLASTPIPDGITVSGISAEWIMERPSVPGYPFGVELSDYNYAFMTYPNACRVDFSCENYLGGAGSTSTQISMWNFSDELSGAGAWNADNLMFFWLAFL